MFSLGMTILYAAVYSSVAQPQTGLDPGVNKMIVAMTDDDYDNRPDVDEVLAVCEENLANCSVTSLKVCHWLISDAKGQCLLWRMETNRTLISQMIN